MLLSVFIHFDYLRVIRKLRHSASYFPRSTDKNTPF
jgi:hypothetical protein